MVESTELGIFSPGENWSTVPSRSRYEFFREAGSLAKMTDSWSEEAAGREGKEIRYVGGDSEMFHPVSVDSCLQVSWRLVGGRQVGETILQPLRMLPGLAVKVGSSVCSPVWQSSVRKQPLQRFRVLLLYGAELRGSISVESFLGQFRFAKISSGWCVNFDMWVQFLPLRLCHSVSGKTPA